MRKIFKTSYFAIILALIYVPILVMLVFSFNSHDNVTSFGGFSWLPYKDLFTNSPFIKSIVTSLFVAVVSTSISLVIGVSAAIGLSKIKPKASKAWFGVANIPLINADIVTAVSLMIIFLLSGIKFGIVTLIMAHVSFNVPYVLITVMPRLRKVDKSIVEAANDLGAKPGQVLFKVILPILKPAIIIAAVIAFAMSFDDFIISYFTGGSQTNVSAFIYTSAKRMKPFIYAFGTIMVLIIVTSVIGWNIFTVARDKKNARKEQLKSDLYKAKKLSILKKELELLEYQLKTNTKIVKTKVLSLWLKYFYLQLKFKISSLKDYDKRISRLQWKIYKLESQISKEKRYYSRRIKTTKTIAKLEKTLAKEKTDVRKAAKFSIQLSKLKDKLEFLNSEIKWIETKEEKAEAKAQEIQKEINRFKHEQSLATTDKDISWYNRKIKILNDWKIEVEEGKNRYKLKQVVTKMKELKAKRNGKILSLSEQIQTLQKALFKQVAITSNNDQTILLSFQIKTTKKMDKVVDQIDDIQIKTQTLKEKLFPAPDDDKIHTKGFMARSWKVILVTLIGVSAFGGLTVAYIENNIYDLVVANWGEYIDESLISQFEKENKVKINYQTYDSNETLFNKTYTFNYDVMVPSDYMVQKMAQAGTLLDLNADDGSGLTPFQQMNLGSSDWGSSNKTQEGFVEYDQSIIDIMNLSPVQNEDKENQTILDYCIPYLVGDLVIVINPTASNKTFLANHGIEFDTDGQITNQTNLSWQLIWDAAIAGKQVALNNDPKNLFMLAGQILNQRANLLSKSEVDQAFTKLNEIISKHNVLLQNDELIGNVGAGNFDFSVMYNGDAIYANQLWNDVKNNDQHFIFGRPNQTHGDKNENTNVFTDNMVISKATRHKSLSYKFVQFIADHATDISDFVGMTSPVLSAQDDLTNPSNGDDASFVDFQNLYFPITNEDMHPGYEMGKEPLSFQFNQVNDDYLVQQYNKLIASKH